MESIRLADMERGHTVNGRLHDCCQRFSNEFVSGLNRE